MENFNFEESLTYDDILLIPQHSKILPSQTNLSTNLTKNITIKIPIISSAMDTVTESAMAIALARLGGIGIIHKNLNIEDQVAEIDIVKRAANGIVNNPETLTPNVTIKEALKMMETLSVTSFPIIDANRKILGIVTNRDFRFVKELNKPVSSIMTKKVITTDGNINLEQMKMIFNKNKIEKLIVSNKKNQLEGLICIKDILNDINYPDASKDSEGRLRVGAACGVNDYEKKRVEALIRSGTDVIVIDSAHGHHIQVIKMVEWVKNKFPSHNVIAGNVATEEGAKALIKAGADAVKVGIGPGSICTTRIVTGIGVPQVTAIRNCIKVCNKNKIPLVADGGIKFSGDMAKALGLGAQTVMLGSILAGANEASGEDFYHNGSSYKVYRGMGSLGAMSSGSGSRERYLQGDIEKKEKLIPEGIEGAVPVKGELSKIVFQIIGGIQSAMGYIGAKNLKEMVARSKFVRVTSAGHLESHVHDVIMIKESPNYKALK